jgi:hypothetical protein
MASQISKMIKLSISIIVLSVKMEHLLKPCIGNGTFELEHGTASKINSYSGEEIRCKSFAAKDTAKERYPKYCKSD